MKRICFTINVAIYIIFIIGLCSDHYCRRWRDSGRRYYLR